MVRAACPDCGTIRIPTNHVTVRARLDAVDYAYRYTCTGCVRIVVRQTTARIAYLLIDAHCPIETWVLPYRGPRLGPPITMVDVLAFGLDFDDWATLDQ